MSFRINKYQRLKLYFKNRPNLLIILSNSSWLLLDRGTRVFVGVFIIAWIARYLGPNQFGEMSYALALVSIVGSLSGLGLNGIVVRELVKKPNEASKILGTTFILQILAGLFSWLIVIILIDYLKPNNHQLKLIVIILGSAYLFKASDVIRYWFESKIQSRNIVIVENVIILMMAVIKIILIKCDINLIGFIWASALEVFFISVAIIFTYSKKVGGLCKWFFDLREAFKLIEESWPLMLALAASIISMKVNQIMLGSYANDTVVGNFAAAMRVAEVWLMIPSILGPSLFPLIISLKEKNKQKYHEKIILMTKVMLCISVILAFSISLSSNLIIESLYGVQYDFAGLYLSLLIWSGVPYIATFFIGQMFFIEGLVRFNLYNSIAIVVMIFVFNLILIPKFGGIGAAISSILVAVISSVFSMIFIQLKTQIFSKKYV